MKNFIDLSYEESLMVLQWRNDYRVRMNMLNKDIIREEKHFDFIEKLKSDSSKQYFLINDIGVIYFTNIINNKAEIGLYSNPIKYGIGKRLMDNILSFNYKVLKLEVLRNNISAKKLYEKYNFKEYTKSDNVNKNIIYMELNNENR